MAISVVQNTGLVRATSGTFNLSFGSLPSTGSTIILLMAGLNNYASRASSDNQGGTSYSEATSANQVATGRWSYISYRENITAPSGTFTVTAGPGADEGIAAAIEVTGLATSSSFDTSANKNPLAAWGEAGSDSATTAALAQASALAVAVISGRSDQPFSDCPAATGHTLIQNRLGNGTFSDSPFASSYLILSSAAALTVTFDQADVNNGRFDNGTMSVAVFKGAGAGATVTYPQLERGLRGVTRGVYR